MKNTIKIQFIICLLILHSHIIKAQPSVIVNNNAINNANLNASTTLTILDNSVYAKQFNENASTLNDANAYLLMYLSSAVYADLITQFDEPNTSVDNLKEQGDLLQKNETAFVNKFRKVMNPLLFNTTVNNTVNTSFFNVPASNNDGYDPEVMVINKQEAIFVVWRGTDRVQNKKGVLDLDYGMREWFQTDFDAVPLDLPSPFKGKAHRGSWQSMMKIANNVANKIEEYGGKNKKVWITGHSLGAGIAQLFSYYLAKTKNIIAQGVYTFATPQFGNDVFNNDLINTLGSENKIQRFEFNDDPITCFAQAIPVYKPVGKRNLYTNLDNIVKNTSERGPAEIARIIVGVPAIATTVIPLPAIISGGMCFHHQHWYLNAAFRQLSATEKSKMPIPLDYKKNINNSCGSADFARAENTFHLFNTFIADPIIAVTNAVDDAIEAVADFSHDFANYLGEFTSNPLPSNYTGYYRIKNLHTGKYLGVSGSCDGKNGCGFKQNTKSNLGDNGIFRIEKYELAGLNFGYSIRLKNTNAVVDVDGWRINDNIQLQTWSKNFPGTPNQAWVFRKVGNNDMHFVILNKQSRKVMDIRGDYEVNGKAVSQYTYTKNRKVQVWILEKVN